MIVTFNETGFAETLRAIEALPGAVERASRTASLRAARIIARDLRRNIRADAPRGTGRLRRSIQVRSRRSGAGAFIYFTSHVPYAWAVDFTRYPRFITGNFERALSSPESARIILTEFGAALERELENIAARTP